jgi:hypothetical protein
MMTEYEDLGNGYHARKDSDKVQVQNDLVEDFFAVSGESGSWNVTPEELSGLPEGGRGYKGIPTTREVEAAVESYMQHPSFLEGARMRDNAIDEIISYIVDLGYDARDFFSMMPGFERRAIRDVLEDQSSHWDPTLEHIVYDSQDEAFVLKHTVGLGW